MRVSGLAWAALACLLVWAFSAGSSSAALSEAVTESMAREEAARARIPFQILVAAWDGEGSLAAVQTTCDSGTSFGPFCIKEIAARQHGCRGDWRQGRGNAACAARILRAGYRICRTWRGAFTYYQWPEYLRRGCKWTSEHGERVYHLMLRRQVEARRIIQVARVEK